MNLHHDESVSSPADADFSHNIAEPLDDSYRRQELDQETPSFRSAFLGRSLG